MASVVLAEGLTRRFGETVAVQDLDLAVERGEIFGLLGHNGAGKTTTVRLLNGVLAPSAGRVRVLGLEPLAEGAALRRRTGVSTETPSLDERLTARQSLTFFADLYGLPRDGVAARVEALAAQFDLSEALEHKVGAYSKGMKQRLALARALLHDPELLFLDEPTSGLDPVAARQVTDLIRRLAQAGKTVLLCTHNLAQAQELCDRVAVLEHGRLVALGSTAELARRFGQGLALRLELAPESLATALELLRRRGLEPQVEGSAVTVALPEREAVPELLAALVGAGARLYQARAAEPSLEEIYFALHRDAPGAREVVR